MSRDQQTNGGFMLKLTLRIRYRDQKIFIFFICVVLITLLFKMIRDYKRTTGESM